MKAQLLSSGFEAKRARFRDGYCNFGPLIFGYCKLSDQMMKTALKPVA